MITDDEGAFPISLRVSRCANGETYEYRLMIGDEHVGKSVFLSGNPTPGQKRHTFMIALGLHQTSSREFMESRQDR